ncbi:DUF4126 domain-containing protein [Proteinivorax tanatarense]|uniref:DUF4126 domain-containing protein n=1 Tax=Proteinivorax tanatarense TaxID=1260629 RepID=A0AAU7VQH4_9FIRM
MILNLLVGIGLSTAAGLRVFTPFLTISIASYYGVIVPPESLEWLATNQAVIVLSVATISELIAYEVPWFNNLLNLISIPFATIAGIIITASFLTDASPLQQWSLSIIAGGGTALTADLFSNTAHVALTATSGGTANPIFSLIESALTIAISVVAIIAITVPVALILVPILFKLIKWVGDFFHPSQNIN